MPEHKLAVLGEDTPKRRVIDIELLAIDLTSCTRCVGTLQNILTAVEAVRHTLGTAGLEVQLRRTLVESEEQAKRHRLRSSPTVRVNGHDIALEARESRCTACTALGGCAEGTTCRIWRYHGRDYSEAPVGLIVEQLLRAARDDRAGSAIEPPPYDEVPDNLKRFFAGRSARTAETLTGPCCPPAEQQGCCEPAEKTSCCGTTTGRSCGCRSET